LAPRPRLAHASEWQLDADRLRGQWVDPRDVNLPVAVWAEES
jgi:hypothetical protein